MAPQLSPVNVDTPSPSDRSRSTPLGRSNSLSLPPNTLTSVLPKYKISDFYSNHIKHRANSRRRAISDPTTRRPLGSPARLLDTTYISSEQVVRPKTSGFAEERSSEQRRSAWFDEPLSDEDISYIPPPTLSKILPRKSKVTRLRVPSVSSFKRHETAQRVSTDGGNSKKIEAASINRGNKLQAKSLNSTLKSTSRSSRSSSQSTAFSANIRRPRHSRSSSQSSESSVHMSDYTFDVETAAGVSRDMEDYFGKHLVANSSKLPSIELSSDGGPLDFTLDIQNYMKTNRHSDKTEREEQVLEDVLHLIKLGQDDVEERTAQLKDAEKQLELVTQELKASKTELLKTRENLNATTRGLKYHEVEAQEAKEELRRTELELSGLKDDLEVAQTERREAQVALREVSEELDEVQLDLQTKARKATETEAVLRNVQADLRITKDELLETADEVERCKEDLEETEIELEKIRAELTGLKSDLVNASASLNMAKADQFTCKQELSKCKENLAEERRAKQHAEAELKVLVRENEGGDVTSKESLMRATKSVGTNTVSDIFELQRVRDDLSRFQADLALSENCLEVEKRKNENLVEELKNDDMLRNQCIKDMDNLMIETKSLIKERDQLKEDRVAFKCALKMAKKKYEDMELGYKKDIAYYKKEVLRMMYERNEAQHFLVKMGANPSYEIYEEFRIAYERTKRDFPPTEKPTNSHIDEIFPAKKPNMPLPPTKKHEYAQDFMSKTPQVGSDECSLHTDDFTVLTVSTFS